MATGSSTSAPLSSCQSSICLYCVALATIATFIPTVSLLTSAQQPMPTQPQPPPPPPTPPSPDLRRRLPDCIVAGVRKGGTRAVLRFLALHPDVAAAEREPHFFDRPGCGARGAAWYRSQMPASRAGQLTVEKTPGYFHSRGAAARLQRFFAGRRPVRLVLVVRNPIDRLVSDYLQVRSNRRRTGRSHPPLERLLLRPRASAPPRLNRRYRPLRRSLYSQQMRRFLRHFPLATFHIVDGDRLARDPYPEMKRLEVGLGLRPHLRQDMFYFNATRGFYCVAADASPAGGGGCLSASKGRRHPPLRSSTRRLLADFLRPHSLAFERLVGRKFHWRL